MNQKKEETFLFVGKWHDIRRINEKKNIMFLFTRNSFEYVNEIMPSIRCFCLTCYLWKKFGGIFCYSNLYEFYIFVFIFLYACVYNSNWKSVARVLVCVHFLETHAIKGSNHWYKLLADNQLVSIFLFGSIPASRPCHIFHSM